MAVEHYSSDSTEPFYFYGGKFSSFASLPFKAKPMFLDRPPLTFKTREHWFAANKTLNSQEFFAILEAENANEAKQLGRMATLIPGWDDGVSFAVMVEGIRHQMRTFPAALDELIATGSRLIAEDSPYDFVWGIRDAAGGWTGKNLLGRSWMRVRSEYASSS